MARPVQTYENHARFLPAFHFFVVPVLGLHVLITIWYFWLAPGRGTAWSVIVALALFAAAFLSRVQALTVQDRVIRLEMRLRLREVLPADLMARIGDLRPQQLVALRFASDAELADLVRDVLDGKVTTSKEIKLRVKNWQPDWLRA